MHIIKHYLVGGFKFRNNLNVAADAADKNNDDDDGIMTITNRKTRTYGIQKHQTQQQKQYKSRRTAASVSSLSKLNSPTSSAANTKPTKMTALNILTTKATTTTARLNMSTKNFGLMSIQMILILLVFLLADSGLNGLHVVAALKGKFQHRIPHILDILQKFNNIIPRKQHPHSLLPIYLETNLPDKSLLLCGNLHMFSMFPKNFT